MARLLKITAIAEAGFFRAGRHWTKAGVTISESLLTEAELESLLAEPNLHVQEVSDLPGGEMSDEDLAARVKAAITALDEDGFDKAGKPKLDALRAALPEAKDRVTAELRDTIWADLKPAG